MEKRPGALPVALHRALGDAECLCHLGVGEATEIAVLHHVAQATVWCAPRSGKRFIMDDGE